MSERAVDCGRRRDDACRAGEGRTRVHRRVGSIGIDGLKAEGYNVVINWLTGYDTVPLSVCTVSAITNPDASVRPAGTFTTVYVDVSCPNHQDD